MLAFVFVFWIIDVHVYLQVASLSAIHPNGLKHFVIYFRTPVTIKFQPQITHTVSRTLPVLLTEVIVTALSNEAYRVASSRGFT
jgi:hypothetical protein